MRPLYVLYSGLIFCQPLSFTGKNQPAQGQQGPCHCQRGDGFVENQSGEDYGDYRGQVDEYAGLYGSQKLHCSVPGNEADGGGSQSQKQQVPQPHRIAKAFQVQPEGKDPRAGIMNRIP